MHRSTFVPIGLAAALWLAAVPVQATSVSSTTLSDFRITLEDLTPVDGVAPSVTLDATSHSVALAGATAPGLNTFWMAHAAGPFGPVSVSGALDGIGGASSVTGDPFGSGATLSASAVGVPGFAGGTGEIYIDNQPSGIVGLTLAAHTQLSFSGLALLDWSAGDPHASADGGVSMGFIQDGPGGEAIVAQDQFYAGYLPFESGPLDGSATNPVSITFANTSDAAVELVYFVNVIADASETDVTPSPVDEPIVLSLLLVGVAAVLLALGRRQLAGLESRGGGTSMPRKTVTDIVVAVGLSLCAMAVHATSVASTTLSDFRITLLDLAPGDGVDPFVTLDPTSYSNAQAGVAAPGANGYWTAQGAGPFGPVSISGALDDGTGGAASFAGDPFASGATLVASAVGNPGFAQGVGEAWIDNQPSGIVALTVGAHSQVTFSGLALLDWNASEAHAAAYGFVSLGFFQGAPGGQVAVDQEQFSAGYFAVDGVGLVGTASDTVSITFANTSDEAVDLDYSVVVYADASEVDVTPSPVPEPDGLALLLAGLAPLLLLRARAP
jgi:hypothetical protein